MMFVILLIPVWFVKDKSDQRHSCESVTIHAANHFFFILKE